MKTQARPPPRRATTHEPRQAKMITPVLWYQSTGDRGLVLLRNNGSMIKLTTKPFVVKLTF